MEVHEDWKVICIEHLQLYIMSWNKKLLRMFQIKLSTTQMCAFSVIMISKWCFSWNHTHTLPILSFLWVYNCIIYTFRVNFQSWYKRKMNFWYLIYQVNPYINTYLETKVECTSWVFAAGRTKGLKKSRYYLKIETKK